MMIQAIFENGVFRPLEPVHLPEHTRVEVVEAPALPPEDEAARDRVYELMSKTFDTGDPYLSSRHDEHQPEYTAYH